MINAKSVKKHLRPVILEPFRAALAALTEWSKEAIGATIEKVAASFEISMGKLGQPIRVAVTSGPVSPPIDDRVASIPGDYRTKPGSGESGMGMVILTVLGIWATM